MFSLGDVRRFDTNGFILSGSFPELAQYPHCGLFFLFGGGTSSFLSPSHNVLGGIIFRVVLFIFLFLSLGLHPSYPPLFYTNFIWFTRPSLASCAQVHGSSILTCSQLLSISRQQHPALIQVCILFSLLVSNNINSGHNLSPPPMIFFRSPTPPSFFLLFGSCRELLS